MVLQKYKVYVKLDVVFIVVTGSFLQIIYIDRSIVIITKMFKSPKPLNLLKLLP